MEYLEYFLIGTAFVLMIWLLFLFISIVIKDLFTLSTSELFKMVGFVLTFITVSTGSGFFIINYLRNTLTS